MERAAFEDLSTQEVLYVEDHPVNVQLMMALFRRMPHLRLVVAESGSEALRTAAKTQPSLLLLDLHLPDCHGTTLLQQLRARPGWADIPAVAVTAEQGFDSAGTDFTEVWPKPLDLAFVLDRLDHFTSQQLPARTWQSAEVELRQSFVG